jgi:hypothetical protein
MVGVAVDVDHCADAARIVLVLLFVQTSIFQLPFHLDSTRHTPNAQRTAT